MSSVMNGLQKVIIPPGNDGREMTCETEGVPGIDQDLLPLSLNIHLRSIAETHRVTGIYRLSSTAQNSWLYTALSINYGGLGGLIRAN